MQELERLEKNNTIKCIWPYVLKIVSEKPVHAYQLRAQIEERFGFRCGRVTAYHALYKLSKRGFVTTEPEGRRVMYSITKKGTDSLKKVTSFYKERVRLLE
jgi:DNA-binding PadR family transcriptional regulator